MSPKSFLDGKVTLYPGDCREQIKLIADCSIDSVVTDPPYALTSQVATRRSAFPGRYADTKGADKGFMGKQWDTGEVAFDPEFWSEVLRVLKPGAHLLAFGGTRTYHHLAMAIEGGGFEVRDCIFWTFGSGFPKSHNIAVAIDKLNGIGPRGKAFNMKGRGDRAEELDANGREFLPAYEAKTEAALQWQGWGSALKPAVEPICLARKPLSEQSIAANVLRHSTGALNIDACRVSTNGEDRAARYGGKPPLGGKTVFAANRQENPWNAPEGRWPANLIHDGSEEVLEGFPDTKSGELLPHHKKSGDGLCGSSTFAIRDRTGEAAAVYGDSGSAARFFYTAKADADDRLGSKHPTVKPVDLIRYLVRLVTPRGGIVLDPFAGTGTTGDAAWREGFNAILIEREPEYQADIERRMSLCLSGPDERKYESIKAAGLTADAGPLFGGGQRDGEPRRRNVAAGFEGEERKKRLRGLRGREGGPE